MYPTFRPQLPTDKIHTVEERYSESEGPWQVAIGFDVEGNAICLCNRGMDIANYCRTEFTKEEKQFAIVKRLMTKRDKQMEHATKTGNRSLRAIARYHKNRLVEKFHQLQGH